MNVLNSKDELIIIDLQCNGSDDILFNIHKMSMSLLIMDLSSSIVCIVNIFPVNMLKINSVILRRRQKTSGLLTPIYRLHSWAKYSI